MTEESLHERARRNGQLHLLERLFECIDFEHFVGAETVQENPSEERLLQPLPFLHDDAFHSITLSFMARYFSMANAECERRFVNTLVSNGIALNASLSGFPLYMFSSADCLTIESK